LSEGDKVVTVGAFLIDSENRLNPMPAVSGAAAGGNEATAAPVHQH
jgi:hypothetical protein